MGFTKNKEIRRLDGNRLVEKTMIGFEIKAIDKKIRELNKEIKPYLDLIDKEKFKKKQLINKKKYSMGSMLLFEK